jgi:hypothetical protein
LPSLISVQISNTVLPDSAAADRAQPSVAAGATTIRITGRYPDARNAARFGVSHASCPANSQVSAVIAVGKMNVAIPLRACPRRCASYAA